MAPAPPPGSPPHVPTPPAATQAPHHQPGGPRPPREFRTSEHATTLGRTTDLARWAIDYAADYHADPLRWSPIAIELFLADWPPGKVDLDPDEVEAMPGVLRAWVRFVGQKRDLLPRHVAEQLVAVDAREPDFREAMGDSSRFGFAKS